MKYLYIIALLVSLSVSAQVTQTLTIQTPDGKTSTVAFNDLKAYKSFSLDSLQVFSHLKQYKSTRKDIKGILLKDVLSKTSFGESPKVLSEYYITCIADDNYKVVFLWNELFNSPTGGHCLVVTPVNGALPVTRPTGIVLVTPTDAATGRSYVKNLKTIRIERVK
jgi:hypothetical protein